jgi:DNA-directed RNA polymerase specialized sigma24 family protein
VVAPPIDIEPLRLPPGTSESGFVGVGRHWKSWCARIDIEGRQYYFGKAGSPIDAAMILAKELHREFGPEWRVKVEELKRLRHAVPLQRRRAGHLVWTPAMDARLLALAATGMTVRGKDGLAARFGLSRNQITQRLHRLANPADFGDPLYWKEVRAEEDQPPARPAGVGLTRQELEHELMQWERFNRGIAGRLAKRFGVDEDDVLSEIQMAWAKAARTFDKRVGFKFVAYASRAAEKQARQFCTRERFRGLRANPGDRFPRMCGIKVVGSEGAEEDFLPDHREATDLPPELPANFWGVALDGLDPTSRTVVLLHFRDGLPANQIGARVGVPGSQVGRIIDAAVAAIREGHPELGRAG